MCALGDQAIAGLGRQLAHRREGASRHPVVATVKRHQWRALGVVAGQLDRGLDGIRTAGPAEENLAGVAHFRRQHREQLLHECVLGRRRQVQCLLQVIAVEKVHHRIPDLGWVVPQGQCSGVRQAIEELLAAGILDTHALAADEQSLESLRIGTCVRLDVFEVSECFHIRSSIGDGA